MTFTLNLTEAELETISSALADYRDYADEATDPEDLIGGTPILERINSIDDKIDEAFAKQ